MNSKQEQYYASKPEPYQGCLLALRQFILQTNPGIVPERKFQIPFFSYKGYKLGYLWLNQRKLMVGFCVDKKLLSWPDGVKPKDQYESFRVDPNADLPVVLIRNMIQERLDRIDQFCK